MENVASDKANGHGKPRDSEQRVELTRTPPLARKLSRRTTSDPHEMAREAAVRQSEQARQRSEQLEAAAPQQKTRLIHVNHMPELQQGHKAKKPDFAPNAVTTSKYNIVTFLPKFLFEMFTRLAYLYFLTQACLSWWSVVSPFGGYGSTAALVFVLLVAAVKAIYEDKKRHQEDYRMNNSKTQRVTPAGTIEVVKWSNVQVGDILLVKDDELFPADLVAIHSALKEKVCFVKTTNLDGETNLKIRKPLDLHVEGLEAKLDAEGAAQKIHRLTCDVECELPNNDLNNFSGKLVFKQPGSRPLPITMNEVLLRGCMLKNSKFIFGIVVYTGRETRIQKNAAKPPLKIGTFDHFLNVQIFLIILVQILMCVFCAAASTIWRDNTGVDRYYLALQSYTEGNVKSSAGYFFLLFITFWILFSYLVPISLFVTMEIVKFWQAFIFINSDNHMVDPETGEAPKARNSNLNEDLGKIDYVFSDKTGTLTANEMRLRMIAIKGVAYGKPDLRLEDQDERNEDALRLFDDRLLNALNAVKGSKWQKVLNSGGSHRDLLTLGTSNPYAAGLDAKVKASGATNDVDVLGYHVIDFFTNLTICQSLIVEDNPRGGLPIYQGPSPDEVALVDAARQLGFEFVNRTSTEVVLNIAGREVKHTILNVVEFSSARQRMSVIARTPDGTIKLYSKGSDNAILDRLSKEIDPSLRKQTDAVLHQFATKGLRTLCLGTKVIDEDTYQEWDARYQKAAASLDNREKNLAAITDEIEQHLELVGVTAIEDKLQDGVPDAIDMLLQAGIKVWMITGDKQETAINIAVSCKLLQSTTSALVCNASSPQQSKARLTEVVEEARRRKQISGKAVAELVIDGKTLGHVIGKKDIEDLLADMGSLCRSVVVCRASPSQKAAIVRIVRRYELEQATKNASNPFSRMIAKHDRLLKGKLLGIGDGANDVAMIQAADIGVGIMGKEGRQAVNNSDYAFSQFRFLVRLLLVHGHLSHYRLGRLIKYSFYKNFTFGFVLFYFQFVCGFSGQALVDDISAAVYNVVFTSLPILLFSVLDKPNEPTSLMRFPQDYNSSESMSTAVFWKTGILTAVFDALAVFFIPFYGATASSANSVDNLWVVGKTVYLVLLGVVTLEVALVARYWTWPFAVVTILSYALAYPFVGVYPYVQSSMGTYDIAQNGIGKVMFASGYYWFSVIGVASITWGLRFFERSTKWWFNPDDNMLIAMHEVGYPGVQHPGPLSPIRDMFDESGYAVKPEKLPQLQRLAAMGGLTREMRAHVAMVNRRTTEDGQTSPEHVKLNILEPRGSNSRKQILSSTDAQSHEPVGSG